MKKDEEQFSLRFCFFLSEMWNRSVELVRVEGRECIPDFELMQVTFHLEEKRDQRCCDYF